MEGFLGSSTSSVKLPLKTNTAKTEERKSKGARSGHPGAGRKAIPPSVEERVIADEAVVGD
jgi:hypothetical protein